MHIDHAIETNTEIDLKKCTQSFTWTFQYCVGSLICIVYIKKHPFVNFATVVKPDVTCCWYSN